MEDDDQEAMLGLPSRMRIVTVFALWWEELERVLYTDVPRATLCMHTLARILDDSITAEEEDWEVKQTEDGFPLISRLVGEVVQDFVEIAEAAFQLLATMTNPGYLKAILRLMVAFKQACWKSGEDFHAAFPQDSMEVFLQDQAALPAVMDDATAASRLAFLAGELVEESNADLPFSPAPFMQLAVTRFKAAKLDLQQRVDEVNGITAVIRDRAKYIKDTDIPLPLPESADNAALAVWSVDEEEAAGSVDHQLLVATGNLRFLAATADYIEALHPSIEADMIGACLDLLSFPHFPLQLFSLGWFVTALTHKKVASELVERGGVLQMMQLTNSVESNKTFYNLITPYASFMLTALAKHPQATEALIRDYRFAEQLLVFGTKMFRFDNIDTKLNIVEWFGEIFGHPLMLLAAQKIGVIPLISWQMKHVLTTVSEEKAGPMKSAFIKEASRSLLKYININLHWAVQHSKGSVMDGVTRGTGTAAAYMSCNIVKVDENQLTAMELYVLRYMALNNQLLPGMRIDLLNRFHDQQDATNPAEAVPDFYIMLADYFPRKHDDDTVSVVSQMRNMSPDWTVARLFLDYDIIPILLMLINTEGKDSTLHTFCLQSLQLLCLDSACIVEIQHCLPYAVVQNYRQADIDELNMKKGLEILLNILSPNVRRDPGIITAALRVLTAMCTPSHYRYNGSNPLEAEKFLQEYSRKQLEPTLPATSIKKSAKKIGFLRDTMTSKLETVQMHARIGVRTYAGISSLVQLIYFRRNQLYAHAVRLETIKVLIGIAHDKEICQILSKMRVETIINNQLRSENGTTAWGDSNHAMGAVSEKALLAFYCSILSEAIATNVAVSERHLDATQEALTRKSVVDKSHVSHLLNVI